MQRHRYYRSLFALSLCIFSVTSSYSRATNCPNAALVSASGDNEAVVDTNTVVRTLDGSFFGFNLEWIPFQNSVWDADKNTLRSEIVPYLKPFAGAVYRYPGGVTANINDWQDMIGNNQSRASRKYASWASPFKNRFGIPEYLNFLKLVNGKGWYILNLSGHYGTAITDKALAKEVKDIVRYFNYQQVNRNSPEVLKWELGNELDRGSSSWLPEKIISRSKVVAAALPDEVAKGKLVSLIQEYPALQAEGISASSMNQQLADSLKPYLSDFSIHLYYDGDSNPQPPVPWFVMSVCRAQADIEKAKPEGDYAIWVTEHARVPAGAFKSDDWKALWPETANQQAAISVADSMIAMVKMPSVKGMFIHSIHGGNSPWPLFHKGDDGYYPSTVFLALKILRESMLPNVLQTQDFSANQSDYEGGYDTRSVLMTDDERAHYSAWIINRAKISSKINIKIPAFASRTIKATARYTSTTSETLNNYSATKATYPVRERGKTISLQFNEAGLVTTSIPPLSIMAIKFDN